MGFLAVAATQLLRNGFRATNKISGDVDRAALGLYFLKATDCDETMDRSACASASGPTTIRLYEQLEDGTVQMSLPADGSANQRGPFQVKAVCDPADLSVKVLAVRASSDAAFNSSDPKDFDPDPVTGKVVTWDDDDANILSSRVPICVNPGRLIPNKVSCKVKMVGLSSASVTYFELLSVNGTSALPLYNNILLYQGPSGSWSQRISFNKNTGAIVGFVDSHGAYLSYPASGSVLTTTAGGAVHVMECPPKLALDGRDLQRP